MVKNVHTLYTQNNQGFSVNAHMIQSFEFSCVSQACCRAGSTLRGLPLRKSHNIARRSKPPVMQLGTVRNGTAGALLGGWDPRTWRPVVNKHGDRKSPKDRGCGTPSKLAELHGFKKWGWSLTTYIGPEMKCQNWSRGFSSWTRCQGSHESLQLTITKWTGSQKQYSKIYHSLKMTGKFPHQKKGDPIFAKEMNLPTNRCSGDRFVFGGVYQLKIDLYTYP